MGWSWSMSLGLAAALWASSVWAGQPLESGSLGGDAIVVDGDFAEWWGDDGASVSPFVTLDKARLVAGAGAYKGPEDLHAELAVAHNGRAFFGAFKVIDDSSVRSEPLAPSDDHLELWFAAPRRNGEGLIAFGVGIFVEPRRSAKAASVLALGAGGESVGGAIRGAKAAFRGDETALQIEVSIPWSAFPSAMGPRKEMHAVVFAVDEDGSGGGATVMGTADRGCLRALDEMPSIRFSDAGSELRAFNEAVGLPEDLRASRTLRANVCGDGTKETVHVVDNYIVVVGCSASGSEFFYREAPVAGGFGVVGMGTEKLPGSGRAALVLRYRDGSGGSEREWTELYSVTADGAFTTIFAALTSFSTPQWRVENAIRFRAGDQRTIAVSFSRGENLSESAVGEAPQFDGNEMVLPWSAKKITRYVYDGTSFIRE